MVIQVGPRGSYRQPFPQCAGHVAVPASAVLGLPGTPQRGPGTALNEQSVHTGFSWCWCPCGADWGLVAQNGRPLVCCWSVHRVACAVSMFPVADDRLPLPVVCGQMTLRLCRLLKRQSPMAHPQLGAGIGLCRGGSNSAIPFPSPTSCSLSWCTGGRRWVRHWTSTGCGC